MFVIMSFEFLCWCIYDVEEVVEDLLLVFGYQLSSAIIVIHRILSMGFTENDGSYNIMWLRYFYVSFLVWDPLAKEFSSFSDGYDICMWNRGVEFQSGTFELIISRRHMKYDMPFVLHSYMILVTMEFISRFCDIVVCKLTLVRSISLSYVVL